MDTVFIIISSILAIISPVIYVKAILKGEAKPHRTTRLILLIITSLATLSLFAQHDTVAIWLALVSMLQSIVLFVLSIKHGMGGFSKMDIVCFGIALVGIVLWQTTKNPSLALYTSILADFVGMTPALVKTYRHPETEIWTYFAIDSVAALFSLLAVKIYTVQQFSYPLYLLVINLSMAILAARAKKK